MVIIEVGEYEQDKIKTLTDFCEKYFGSIIYDYEKSGIKYLSIFSSDIFENNRWYYLSNMVTNSNTFYFREKSDVIFLLLHHSNYIKSTIVK